MAGFGFLYTSYTYDLINITDNIDTYEDFYDELDIQMESKVSMNIIFFGPPDSFMRLDAETILHIFSNTKKQFIPIKKVLQAWDIITGKTD